MDLDQALHLERAGGAPDDPAGAAFVVHYAIADVGAFVVPGGAIDAEVHERGTTLYAPDGRTPLHPAVLSEGAASLLPGEDRPAAAWRVVLDARGEILDATVRRAVVRSTQRLTYDEAQARIDTRSAGDDAGDALLLLREVGELRLARERERGGVSLEVPEQEIVTRDDGSFGLEFRSTLPAEAWNAQVSLLTGHRGGADHARGRRRRLPRAAGGRPARRRAPAPHGPRARHRLAARDAVRRARPDARLARPAPRRVPQRGDVAVPGRVVRGVRRHGPGARRARRRGARRDRAEYAHVTAPLRRSWTATAPRCASRCARGRRAAVGARRPARPAAHMARTGQRASAYERAIVDVVEAALLTGREGEEFDGVVVDVEDDRERAAARARGRRRGGRGRRGQVVLADPAVRAPSRGRTSRSATRSAPRCARRRCPAPVRFTVG
nr:RNB domain-containing ribonuclease [Cellulosimicrobium sp. MM]